MSPNIITTTVLNKSPKCRVTCGMGGTLDSSMSLWDTAIPFDTYASSLCVANFRCARKKKLTALPV